MNDLIKFLHSIHPLSEAAREHLFETLQTREVRKNERILKAGVICSNICFVGRGLFRVMHTDRNKESCAWFMREGDVLISVASFFKRQPSTQSIYAIEAGVVYFITYDQLYHIFRTFPEFNYVGRELAQRYHVLGDERWSMLTKTVDERYDHMLRSDPGLLKRIPAIYLASYLGITQGTLSRVKGRRDKELK